MEEVFKNWYDKNVGTRLLGFEEVSRIKEAFRVAWDHQQAEIDRLMLEFCPDEMTDRQYEVWYENQRVVQKPEVK